MKRLLSLILALALALSLAAPALASPGYSDVPADSWALGVIKSATDFGLVEGRGGGVFGYGAPVKRAEFVTALCRMFGWTLETPESGSFPDVGADKWHYTYIETALSHGVFDKSAAFRPEEAISREDMAVMLARALGYTPLAEAAEKLPSPFTDVRSNKGYITVAYDIGMVEGMGGGIFAPASTARREEMAAILVRVYEKLVGKTQWLHGFYAFSSYPQREVTREMDAVSAGWSRLSLDGGAVYLNTGASNGNEWRIPESYESITRYLDEGGTPLHLDVYMDNADGVAASVLTDAAKRSAAVEAIAAELTRVYDKIGKNPYSGVTIDFEGLYGKAQREGLSAFLTELDAALDKLGKSLYVTVQAVTEGEHYDGYDYRAIGNAADKVILMAHDYNAVDLRGFEGTAYYKTTALTPLASVYVSLRAATDPDTGVADKSKLAIAVSFSSLAWTIKDGKLVEPSPSYPAVDTIYKRLSQPEAVLGWSDTYKNPYVSYTTESGEDIFLWYENGRSVSEKLTLARLFGINGVSVWRIGNIPAYPDPGMDYDAWAALKG